MRRIALAATVGIVAGSTSLHALTNEENFSRLSFNLNTPGARSIAMGATFIARADDATAAEANPAGLTTLLQPEVSLEMKFLSSNNQVLYGSVPPYTPQSAPVYRDFRDQHESISFLSVVYPWEDWAFSFSRHEQVTIDQHFSTEGAVIAGTSARFYPAESNTDITVSNYVFAAGYQFREDLKLGASVKMSRLNWNSTFRRFTTNEFDPGGYYPGAMQTWEVEEKKTGFGFNIGAIYEATDWISVGGVYKRNASFDVTERYTAIFQPKNTAATRTVSTTQILRLKVPDTIGAGVSITPAEDVLINFDIQRVQYSDLLDDFVITLSGISQKPVPEEFTVDNATELHVGAEYMIPYEDWLFAVRAGVYTDPEHAIVYTGADPALLLLFPKGEDATHVTFGGGVVLSENYQIDAAVDWSKNAKAFVISTVARF